MAEVPVTHGTVQISDQQKDLVLLPCLNHTPLLVSPWTLNLGQISTNKPK